MKIDVKDLLGSVRAIRKSGTRIGYPDDPTIVEIADPARFSAVLDDALCAFRDFRGGMNYLVDAEVNTYNRAVWVRFVQPGLCQHHGRDEPALVASFQSLRDEIGKSLGELSYWGGNNYFDLKLPFHGPMREAHPELRHLPWDERYQYELQRMTWECLRAKVFRFSAFADSFSNRCFQLALSHVLIPSVGLCVHPWLFADSGLSITATDASATALKALAEPDKWPRMYSRAAFERWDIDQSAAYALDRHPDHFERMPDLLNPSVRKSLGKRIDFVHADWAGLPLRDASVDAIFATNALPRDSSVEQTRVLREWIRVVRPGGAVFIAQHNFYDSGVETVLDEAGWASMDILGGDRPHVTGAVGFQICYSSG